MTEDETIRPTILVADDEEAICDLLTMLLTDLRCRVVCAHTRDSVLRWLDAEPFDLVLLDCVMPGNAEIPLADQVRARGIQLVQMSGHPAQIEKLSGGTERFLPKPFRVKEV